MWLITASVRSYEEDQRHSYGHLLGIWCIQRDHIEMGWAGAEGQLLNFKSYFYSRTAQFKKGKCIPDLN